MKYFTIKELCRSTTASRNGIDNEPNIYVKRNLIKLVDNVLDPLREWYGKPIYINSGYRCPLLNQKVGGVPTSHHQYGYAVDIDMGGKKDNLPLFNYIKDNLPFTELGWEKGGSWIHVSYIEGKIDKEVFNA